MRTARTATVVGVGYSSVHRALGVDTRPLAVDACLGALDDAGLATSDIDAIFEYPGVGTQNATLVQRLLGIGDLKAYADIGGTGPSGLAAALSAVAAVESGICEVALVYRSVDREWGQQSGTVVAPPANGPAQFQTPYGDFGGIIPAIGMKKFRRLAELGGSEEDYGWIAVNARRWAALNERAVLRTPVTMDDYLESRFVAEPLRLLDCDYPVTGVCATVITTAERARDLAAIPVTVDSSAFGTGSRPDWTFTDDFIFGGTIGCAQRLWENASVSVGDVDVAELYDGFTHITLSWVEALGFCGIGEFGDWVDSGKRIAPGGDLPLNTNGGQLAAGRLHGLAFLNEAVEQLRGDCGERQVPDARVAVVANAHGPQCGAMVLTR
ncbi:thiolase family protein [Peterkaempfera bronchialis]|uniref:Thiolase family protein n=1 Tax=Peterkaempfera bronchialis TaxID=2126346 RepID=A0A345SRE9_9ACTN|nr:thiolase family protein [Peterkaempfera bronchialis]AXI76304.1 thiolase family protein [Peterkaempfera bronchialis]